MRLDCKSVIYAIAIFLAMAFFVDSQAMAQPNVLSSSDTLDCDTVSQKSMLFFKTFIDSNSRYSYRKIYGLFLRKAETKTSEIIEEHDPTERFEKYSKKEIAEIRYLRLRAFGQSVYNLDLQPIDWKEQFGNALHTTTLKEVIAHNVLFKQNDLLRPIDLVETEQVLRSRSYIEDACIMVEPMSDTGKVCVTVITKDRYTGSAHLNFSNFDVWDGGISESNFCGGGIILRADVYQDKRLEDRNGYKFEVEVGNIWGSFISTKMYYRRGVGYNSKYVNFNRDFFASKVRIAGGVTYMDSKERYGVYILDTTISIKYTIKDCWLGYSIPLGGRNVLKAPFLLTLATKYRLTDFYEGLPTLDNFNPYFASTKHYLVSLGFSRQNLYQSNLIYQFGSTEDIPVGFKVQFATGFEEDDFQRRYLVNGEVAGANYFKIGYLYGSVQVGGYVTELNRLEQASLSIKSTYISNLFNIRGHKLRQFVSLSYTDGFTRFSGEREYIVLGNHSGIRGLQSNRLAGKTRMYVNLETVAYSPYDIRGFRIAYFGFVDVGRIESGVGECSDDCGLYSAFGVGLHLRNEATVFPTIVIGLAYYPRIPSDGTVSNYYITSQRRRRFEQFRSREPQLLPYR